MNEPKWQQHWNDFLTNMVYEKEKPSYDQAQSQFRSLSNEIFEHIKT